MSKWMWRIVLLIVLLIAAVLRFTGLDWDDYEHYHPDERYITWVATSIEAPTSFSSIFDPQASNFNPFYWPADVESEGIRLLNDEQRDFAYGHLPLYVGVLATRFIERFGGAIEGLFSAESSFSTDILNTNDSIEFDHLLAVGRMMTALADVGTVLFIYLLGARLYGRKAGMLAASFAALTVLNIQLAHFFTADPYTTLFTVITVYNMVVALQSEQRKTQVRRIILAALAAGLAIGSKFSAVLLGLPMLLTLWWVFNNQTPEGEPARSWKRDVGLFFATGLTTLAAFALTNPYAILDFTCQAWTPGLAFGSFEIAPINWGSCYGFNIGKQSGMVNGSADFAFTRQYTGTLPFLYYIEMQLKWGLGWPLGILAYLGFGWGLIRAGRALKQAIVNRNFNIRPSVRAELILLAWVIPFFTSTGTFFVKFMRYMQPAVPFLLIYAAGMLMLWKNKNARNVVVVLSLFLTLLYAVSFANIYREEHPWVVASEWIYENIPAGSEILTEQWGDRLPTTIRVGDEIRSAGRYAYKQDLLTWLTGTEDRDSATKLEANLDRLASADFIAIDSNRIYGVVPRLEERYPNSSQAYQLLFDGSLGYELVFTTNRSPQLGGNYLQPDFFSWPGVTPPAGVADYFDQQSGIGWGRVDESFTLYDQSLVMIFENTGRLSAESMRQLFTINN